MSRTSSLFRVLVAIAVVFALFVNNISGLAIPISDVTSPDESFEQKFVEVNFNGHVLHVASFLAVDSTCLTIDTTSRNATSTTSEAQSLEKRADECDGFTVEGRTTSNSPVWNDCVVVRDYLRTLGGRYGNVGRGRGRNWYQKLIWHGTCTFGAAGLLQPAIMGADNVADLIKIAAARFQAWDPALFGLRLGAVGTTSCYPE
jgi:hypothetical protein